MNATYTLNTWPSNKSNVWNDLFMIGFDKLWNNTVTNTGFPYYNVAKIGEDKFQVEIALAGFAAEEVEIQEHKSSLLITGNRNNAEEKKYLYKGISNRAFTRTFALAEHVHVTDARMENGMLMITLRREVPEDDKPKTIAISNVQQLMK